MHAFRFAVVGTVAMALTACSTVQARREDPPTFAGSTSKTLPEFQGCFARQFASKEQQPSYLPSEHGGTYIMRIGLYQNSVAWVLDVDDDGQSRKAVLHAKNSIWGKPKELIAMVRDCL